MLGIGIHSAGEHSASLIFGFAKAPALTSTLLPAAS